MAALHAGRELRVDISLYMARARQRHALMKADKTKWLHAVNNAQGTNMIAVSEFLWVIAAGRARSGSLWQVR